MKFQNWRTGHFILGPCNICITRKMSSFNIFKYIFVVFSHLYVLSYIVHRNWVLCRGSWLKTSFEWSLVNFYHLSANKTRRKSNISNEHFNETEWITTVILQEIPDSALSSTSNGRGLYHDQPGIYITIKYCLFMFSSLLSVNGPPIVNHLNNLSAYRQH